jgi:hypothetical protein
MLSISTDMPACGDGVAGEGTPSGKPSQTGKPDFGALVTGGVWVAGLDGSVGSAISLVVSTVVSVG